MDTRKKVDKMAQRKGKKVDTTMAQDNKKLTKQEKREKREQAMELRIASRQISWVHTLLSNLQDEIAVNFPDTCSMQHIQAALDRLKHASASLYNEADRV